MFQITLRAARVNCGLNLKEVAQKVNKTPETIAKYEKDSSRIPRDLMDALLAVYGIPQNYIFFGKEFDFMKRRLSA